MTKKLDFNDMAARLGVQPSQAYDLLGVTTSESKVRLLRTCQHALEKLIVDTEGKKNLFRLAAHYLNRGILDFERMAKDLEIAPRRLMSAMGLFRVGNFESHVAIAKRKIKNGEPVEFSRLLSIAAFCTKRA